MVQTVHKGPAHSRFYVLERASTYGIKVLHVSEFKERYLSRATTARAHASAAGGAVGASAAQTRVTGAAGRAGKLSRVETTTTVAAAAAASGGGGFVGKGKGRAVVRITEQDYEPLGPYHLKIEDGSGLYRPIIGIWPPDEDGNPT